MKIAGIVLLGVVLIVGCYAIVSATILNPRVVRELESDPAGERARKVMALTLPSGKSIPVNYFEGRRLGNEEGAEGDLQAGEEVYAAADFPWWRELQGEGDDVEILVRGERRRGHARAIEDDESLRTTVFDRLRPTAPAWTGVLVEIVVRDDGSR